MAVAGEDISGFLDIAGGALHAFSARMEGRDGFTEAVQAADKVVALKKEKIAKDDTQGFFRAILGGEDPAEAAKAFPHVEEGFLQQLAISQINEKKAAAKLGEQRTYNEGQQASDRTYNEGQKIAGEERQLLFDERKAAGLLARNQQAATDQAMVGGILSREAAATPNVQGVRLDPAAGAIVPTDPRRTSVIPHQAEGFLGRAGVTPQELQAGAEARQVMPGFALAEQGYLAQAAKQNESAAGLEKTKAEIAYKNSLAQKALNGGGASDPKTFDALFIRAALEDGMGYQEAAVALEETKARMAGSAAFSRSQQGTLGGATPAALGAAQARSAASAAGTVEGSAGKLSPIPNTFDPATGLPVFANNRADIVTGSPAAGVVPTQRPSDASLAVAGLQNNATQALARIRTGFNPDWVGPVAGRVASMKEGTVGIPDDQAAFYADLRSIADTELRKRSGAAITPDEYKRLMKIMPDPNTPAKVFISRLNRYERELQDVIEGRAAKKAGKPAPPVGTSPAPPAPGIGIEYLKRYGGNQ